MTRKNTLDGKDWPLYSASTSTSSLWSWIHGALILEISFISTLHFSTSLFIGTVSGMDCKSPNRRVCLGGISILPRLSFLERRIFLLEGSILISLKVRGQGSGMRACLVFFGGGNLWLLPQGSLIRGWDHVTSVVYLVCLHVHTYLAWLITSHFVLVSLLGDWPSPLVMWNYLLSFLNITVWNHLCFSP